MICFCDSVALTTDGGFTGLTLLNKNVTVQSFILNVPAEFH